MQKPIVSRPASTVWLVILLLLVILFIGYWSRQMNHPGNSLDTDIIISGCVVGALILLFLFQLKKVTISDGRIRIYYFLRLKSINASLDAITSVSVSLTKASTRSMRAVGMTHGLIKVNILNGKHVLKMHSMYCSNLPAFEEFFRAHCAEKFSYGRIDA